MNIAQTTELAALIATHSQHVIESPSPFPEEALRNYWDFSKKQLLHWMSELNSLEIKKKKETNANGQHLHDIALQSILEEIFISEILTRVWSAMLAAADQRQNAQIAEPVARGVYLFHLQARHRALTFLVDGGLSPVRVGAINKLRRRCERWTDLLLGQIGPQYNIDQFTFDAQRVKDLGENSSSTATEPLLQAGIRMAFHTFDFINRQVTEFQHQIITSILAAFPIDAFSQSGTFRATSHVRIHRSADRESEPFNASTTHLLEQITPGKQGHRRFDKREKND